MNLPQQVKLVEVGPRDGLQNEKEWVPTAAKIQLIEKLIQAGSRHIEVTSFVSPKWVPQMADNQQIMQALTRVKGCCYSVLVPNLRGFEDALITLPNEIVIFASASESFSQRNINCSIHQSLERFAPVIQAAHSAGISVRATVSCALGCPYEGAIPLHQVEFVVKELKALGADDCDIADTIGVGTPRHVQKVMEKALQHFPLPQVSGHFHDTYGQALSNIYACLELGIATFDTSVAGLGGCPYAKGATGNVATEDVLFMIEGLEIETGLNMQLLLEASALCSGFVGRPSHSRAGAALLAKKIKH
jgi:hydroxymethylglutaryl-CoA lyase